MMKSDSGSLVLKTAPDGSPVGEAEMAFEDQTIPPASSDHTRPIDDNSKSPVKFTLAPLKDQNALGQLWQQLQKNFEPSLFQSWEWMECWLRVLPDTVEPFVLTAFRSETPCGVAIICRQNRRRHGWLLSRGLFLNETGVQNLDALTIEYNGLLCRKEEAPDLTLEALSYLKSELSGWDEFTFSGIDIPTYTAFQNTEYLVNVVARLPCNYVDLSAIRDKGTGYIDCLSRNTRSQIRRALRRYEERGDVEISVAGTVEQALDYFEEMRVLHQDYWVSRGQPGAFANPIFGDFHSGFIKANFAAGLIEMLQITAAETTLGYLYNIVHEGRVYNYQSGFNYEADGSMKPGLVAHYVAIERSLQNGAAIYDFMAGDAQQKRSLGTDSQELIWATTSLPRFKFRLEGAMRALKHMWSTGRAD